MYVTLAFFITIAALTFHFARCSSSPACSGSAPVTIATIRRARSFSLSDPVCTSTIKLPYVLPMRIIAIVVSMLRTIFVAVPAFKRVEPARTSGPVSTTTARSHATERAPASHATIAVFAPSSRARASAAWT